jgi:hypothetical protein
LHVLSNLILPTTIILVGYSIIPILFIYLFGWY